MFENYGFYTEDRHLMKC